MEYCNDFWCEHHGKNSGVCSQCIEKNIEKNEYELRIILQRHAVRQMVLDEITQTNSQSR